jgi:hypothetical protein
MIQKIVSRVANFVSYVILFGFGVLAMIACFSDLWVGFEIFVYGTLMASVLQIISLHFEWYTL